MKKAIAVIDAGYGDGGKGNLVSFYAHENPGAIVIRASGGANAGHTVQTPDGRRHVFSHFGAGSFDGASTYLSEHFIAHPFLWQKEIVELRALGVEPKVYIDGEALLSTPYDALINRALEQSRGGDRHGSCGSGINETVVRCLQQKFRTVCAYTIWPHSLRTILVDIRDRYVPARMAELGIAFEEDIQCVVASDAMLDDFIKACEEMRTASSLTNYSILTGPEPIIFEGSQGLALDAEHRFFPHVTRARTGLTNVMDLARKADLDVDVTYVTRAYCTRHGAGPFPQHTAGVSYPDPTNQPNEWQGSLRFGNLDLDFLSDEISSDMAKNNFNGEITLAVTCLDQLPEDVEYSSYFRHREGRTWQDLVHDAAAITGADKVLTSFGPTRETISTFDTSDASDFCND